MTRAVLVAILVAVACGSDTPGGITGLYMTTAHERSLGDCSDGTTPDSSPPYFRVVEREADGTVYFGHARCQDTDPASCAGGGFVVEETDGYRGHDTEVDYWPDPDGGLADCTLTYYSFAASLEGDQLTWENRTYSEYGKIDPCNSAEAEARADEMPCIDYEIMVGTRVPE